MKSYGHKDLPPSSDKKFWNPDGRAESERYQRRPRERRDHGGFKEIGGNILCTYCENQHTVSFNRKKFTIKDGEIVRILDEERQTVKI